MKSLRPGTNSMPRFLKTSPFFTCRLPLFPLGFPSFSKWESLKVQHTPFLSFLFLCLPKSSIPSFSCNPQLDARVGSPPSTGISSPPLSLEEDSLSFFLQISCLDSPCRVRGFGKLLFLENSVLSSLPDEVRSSLPGSLSLLSSFFF